MNIKKGPNALAFKVSTFGPCLGEGQLIPFAQENAIVWLDGRYDRLVRVPMSPRRLCADRLVEFKAEKSSQVNNISFVNAVCGAGHLRDKC